MKKHLVNDSKRLNDKKYEIQYEDYAYYKHMQFEQ